MRRALGFMGAGPLARSVCPVAKKKKEKEISF
jgi:hypothetical protein